MFSQLSIKEWHQKSPNEICLYIDKHIKDSYNTATAEEDPTAFSSKKDWNRVLINRHLNTSEDQAKLAGDLFQLLQISNTAMLKYSKELVEIKAENAELKEENVALKEAAGVVYPTAVSDGDKRSIQQIVKEELNSINPVIRATIKDAVKEALPTEICTKTDIP